MMTDEKRVIFIMGYLNRLLTVANIGPLGLTLRDDRLVNFGSLDGKYYMQGVHLKNVVQSVLENLFSGYMELSTFAEKTKEYFSEHNILTYYAVINTKPIGKQKYFEKKYYVVETESDKDLQIEVTQIGKKNMKVVGFIIAGQRRHEFDSPEEIIQNYIRLYTHYLCEIL